MPGRTTSQRHAERMGQRRARSGSWAWNDKGSPARWMPWEEAELRPYEGRLPRPAISEREAGSGTT